MAITALKRKTWSPGSHSHPRQVPLSRSGLRFVTILGESIIKAPNIQLLSIKYRRAHLLRWEKASFEPPAKRARIDELKGTDLADMGQGEGIDSSQNGTGTDKAEHPEELRLSGSEPVNMTELEDDSELAYGTGRSRLAGSPKIYDVVEHYDERNRGDYPWKNADAVTQFLLAPDINDWISVLRDGMIRPSVPGDALRIKILAKSVKRKLRSGKLTQDEILELMEQRPPQSMWPDRASTPESISETERPSNWDDTEFEEEDSSAPPERPTTPLPPDDSDSDCDTDEDQGPPVYSSNRIAEYLSRREMEMMGIYPDEE